MPCFFFDNDFVPRFALRTPLLGDAAEPYDGPLWLVVVGGGPGPPPAAGAAGGAAAGAAAASEWRDYSPAEQRRYNPGINLEEGATVAPVLLEDLDVPGVFQWMCWPGSPCSGVLPAFGEVPEYYFRFVAFTAFNGSALPSASYCNYSATFLVRVHNLPLDVVLVMSTITGTMLLLFGATAAGHWLYLRHVASLAQQGQLGQDLGHLARAHKKKKKNKNKKKGKGKKGAGEAGSGGDEATPVADVADIQDHLHAD